MLSWWNEWNEGLERGSDLKFKVYGHMAEGEHDSARWLTRTGLTAVAAPLKVGLFGSWVVMVVGVSGVVVIYIVMRRRNWRRSRSVLLACGLAFAFVIVYAYLIEAPVAMADYSELDIYYYTEDHIGRPFALRDDDQVLRWFEMHYPFGEVIEEDTPNGDMSAGLGDYAVTWKPNFRFPGQYEDIDMFPFTHNHYREYLPQFGRYNRVDPLIELLFIGKSNEKYDSNAVYGYPNNPLLFLDFLGLKKCESGNCPDCPSGSWGPRHWYSINAVQADIGGSSEFIKNRGSVPFVGEN